MSALPPEQQDFDPDNLDETSPEPDDEPNDDDGYGSGPDDDGGAPGEGANPPLPAG